MPREYKPIACGLYDELELRALRKKKVRLTFLNIQRKEETIECVIGNIFSKDKVEFLTTAEKQTIRLDDIIAVDGIIFNANC